MQAQFSSSLGRSVLLIRLSAIGDVVMASGLITALRTRYPEVRLAWLVQPEARGLLEAHPGLDEVIVLPRGEWRRLLREGRWWRLGREIARFVRALRARRFDSAIDLQGLIKSGIWARLSGAPVRIGLGSKEGSGRLMTRVVDRPRGNDDIAAEYVRLATLLGADADSYRMHVAVREADAMHIQELLARAGMVGRYAVFCPFTTRPQKHWFDDRWVELARVLPARLGMPIVIAGGPGDRAAADRIVAHAPMVDLVGRTTIAQAAALIRDAALLVGVDTGLTHLGTAFGIPTVVLFGSTRPYLKTYSPRTRVLYHRLDCSPCHRRPTCDGAFHCMRRIAVDEVMATAQRLIE